MVRGNLEVKCEQSYKVCQTLLTVHSLTDPGPSRLPPNCNPRVPPDQARIVPSDDTPIGTCTCASEAYPFVPLRDLSESYNSPPTH
ncbi:hypothetical protein J1614_006336 [Plenodomus biglobosus]|nr:hypothetical protein J1614_006336 [Plenodomus biglobosus]